MSSLTAADTENAKKKSALDLHAIFDATSFTMNKSFRCWRGPLLVASY
jgi:hypothetical protein